ncbi:MAG: hypothetical protein K2N03_07300, partial [Muribaculaceae bacterium]|nr:hypothetical protein [Muribaculaceae bacterium]
PLRWASGHPSVGSGPPFGWMRASLRPDSGLPSVGVGSSFGRGRVFVAGKIGSLLAGMNYRKGFIVL